MNRQRTRAIRILACAVVLTLCFLIESGFSLKISFFGVHIDMLPPIIASASVCLGCPAGIVCGLIAGMLYDTSGLAVQGLLPLYYMLWGIISGFVGEHYRFRHMRCVLVLSIGMTVLLSTIRYLFYFQFTTDISIATFLIKILLQAVLTAIICPFVFAIIRRIAGRQPQRMKKIPRGKKRRDRNG